MLQIFLVKILQYFWRLLWGGYQKDFWTILFRPVFLFGWSFRIFSFQPCSRSFFHGRRWQNAKLSFLSQSLHLRNYLSQQRQHHQYLRDKTSIKSKKHPVKLFETVLNVGFRKVCSGTCVVCGLSAGDLDCLVFNRALFAVTILVSARWTGKMIIVQKIVFHEIKFNPNLILSFLLLYDNLKKKCGQ